ncbi:MAG: peptidylprolyl isomerase [bacterium]|nr:peptidylprolyl isomerase [bacterium]
MNGRAMAYVLICLACVAACAGCGPGEREAGPAEPPAGTDAVAATVNGVPIKAADVDRAVEEIAGRYGGALPPEQMGQMRAVLRPQALEALISEQLLVQEADREGIAADEQAVEAQLRDVAARFPGPGEFREVLAARGMAERDVRAEIDRALRIELLLARKIGGAGSVSDEEVSAFHKEHPDEFHRSERVRASHVLIKADPESEEERAAARGKIAELRRRIEEGEDFSAVAAAHSECPSAAQGGDLGFFERGSMVEAFEDAAFGMEVGQVSDPVETEFGCHIIKLTGREDERDVPLEEVREGVARHIDRMKRQKAVGDYLRELRGAAKIEYPGGGPS